LFKRGLNNKLDCPKCHKSSFEFEGASKVLESRSDKRGGVRRRRICPACSHKFTTYEIRKDMLQDKTLNELAIYKHNAHKVINKSREIILFAFDKILLALE